MSKVRKKETTDAQFSRFKSAFKAWMIRFGLIGWYVGFEIVDDDSQCGSISINAEDLKCMVMLSRWKPENEDKDWIEETAKHEAIHLLLGRLTHLARERYVRVDELAFEEEKVVRALEKNI